MDEPASIEFTLSGAYKLSVVSVVRIERQTQSYSEWKDVKFHDKHYKTSVCII